MAEEEEEQRTEKLFVILQIKPTSSKVNTDLIRSFSAPWDLMDLLQPAFCCSLLSAAAYFLLVISHHAVHIDVIIMGKSE